MAAEPMETPLHSAHPGWSRLKAGGWGCCSAELRVMQARRDRERMPLTPFEDEKGPTLLRAGEGAIGRATVSFMRGPFVSQACCVCTCSTGNSC